MKMIQCHTYNGNRKIFINVDYIESFQEAEDWNGTDIFMKIGQWIAARESLTDIQNLIIICHLEEHYL